MLALLLTLKAIDTFASSMQRLAINQNIGNFDIPTCIPFDSYSSHQDMNGTWHEIGWIKVISCTEGQMNNAVFTYHRCDIKSLSSSAISIKIQPPSGTSNNLAVIAKPHSNPISALNDYKEVSYQYHSTQNNVTGLANTTYWEGTATALARLQNEKISAGAPHSFENRIYHASNNGDGMHVIPNVDGTTITKCLWDNGVIKNSDMEIHVGFAAQECASNEAYLDPCGVFVFLCFYIV